MTDVLGDSVLILRTDNVPLNRGLKAAEAATVASGARMQKAMGARVSAMGATMGGVGKSMTRNVTLPIIGLGIAADKMADDFEEAMTRVHTQAGASKKEVANLKGEVLKLAKRSTFGPEQLAGGLYQVESAGYRGAKAMKVLDAAQKLAMVGGTDLEQTTKALVAAQSTGIKGTGTMSKTIGTLNAIVGQGNMKMGDLVGALSTGVLPSAKAAGLSLGDVGAALDIMTRRGVPAQAAATRLRQTFSMMVAPTDKAKEALKEIGLDQDDLARELRKPDGLLKSIEMLQEHLRGVDKVKQGQIVSAIFGGGRTSSGIMTLLGSVEELGKVYDDTRKKAGDFGKAVKATSETDAAKQHKLWSTIQADLIKIGDVVGPVIMDTARSVVGVVDKVATAFAKLPKPVQGAILKGGLIIAAIGPALRIAGALTGAMGRLLTMAKVGAVAGVGSKASLSQSVATMQVGTLVARSMAGGPIGGGGYPSSRNQSSTGKSAPVPVGAPVGPGKVGRALNRVAGALPIIGLGALGVGSIISMREEHRVKQTASVLKSMRETIRDIDRSKINDPGFKPLEEKSQRIIDNLDEMPEAIRKMYAPAKQVEDQFKEVQALTAKLAGEGLDIDPRGHTKRQIEDLSSSFRTLQRGSGTNIRSMMVNFGLFRKAVRKNLGDGTKEAKDAVAQGFTAMEGAIRRSMDNGEISTQRGMEIIAGFVAQALSQYGIGPDQARGFLRKYAQGGGDARGNVYYAGGGALRQVGRAGERGRDTVPAMLNGQPSVIANGEVVGVFNWRQKAGLDAMSMAHGYGGLEGFVAAHATPHYMAAGGILPRAIAPGAARLGRVGVAVQAGTDRVHDAAEQSLQKVPILKMIKFARGVDGKDYPYVYGGGHGSFNGPYDCSGFVSAILHAGGMLSSPMTTDGFKTYGIAGDGSMITIGVRGSTGRSAHMMVKLGDTYWESGSGHGAMQVGGWAGNFPIHRHPKGFAAGGIINAVSGLPGVLNDDGAPYFLGYGLSGGFLSKKRRRGVGSSIGAGVGNAVAGKNQDVWKWGSPGASGPNLHRLPRKSRKGKRMKSPFGKFKDAAVPGILNLEGMFPLGTYGNVATLMGDGRSSIGAMIEKQANQSAIFDRTEEEFIITPDGEDADGNPLPPYIDQGAVDARAAEIIALLGMERPILDNVLAAHRPLNRLSKAAKTTRAQLKKRIAEIRDRVRANLRRLRELNRKIGVQEKNIERSQEAIAKERRKKKPDKKAIERHQSDIKGYRGFIRGWRGEVREIEKENRALTGSPDSMADGGRIGHELEQIQRLNTIAGNIHSWRSELVGTSGQGGLKYDVNSILYDLMRQAGELGPDALAKALAAATPEKKDVDAKEGDPHADLYKAFYVETKQREAVARAQQAVLSQLPPFGGSFADGGIVPGPVGAARTVIAHGGEAIGDLSDTQVILKFADGMSWLKDFVDVRVERGTRGQSRRAGRGLPGGGGGVIRG